LNYELLFHELQGRRIRIALTGANGGFGRTFIAQCRIAPQVDLSVLCDRDIEGLHATLLQMGFAPNTLLLCTSEADVRNCDGRIALVADAGWLAHAPHDILIEATGAPEASVALAEAALRRRVHVGMVTKETDSVVGPWLNRLALEHGVVYTTVDGDQPAALIELVTWARVLGFDVVCAGKASEHDFIYDPKGGAVTHAGVSREVPGLDKLWSFGADVASTLEARRRALHEFPLNATPDYCEMNVVANSTGLLPACDALSYPLCRTSELADVYVPVDDGGILTRTGVVDVFNALRRHDEASFGGGVFVIVRCTDRAVWQLLQEKGHVVGKSGRYACIYRPFHLMGLESLHSVYSAVLHGRSSGSTSQQQHALMVARATRDLRAGEVLAMGGHMHEIQGVTARLLPTPRARGAAPYYLAANKRLLQDVACGTDVPAAALSLEGSALARALITPTPSSGHFSNITQKEHP
jgi:predicted homoserine dehydrogenase-like protein